MEHHCHARGCATQVKPELLMCWHHWKQVPKTIQQAVYLHYRVGQCDDKSPSREWFHAAEAAIGYVAQQEGRKLRQVEMDALGKFGFGESMIKMGSYIKYARGAKGTLIGQCGYVESEVDDQGIVMVKFDSGNSYPCWIKNLEIVSAPKVPKVVHCKSGEPYDVYVARPSKFGNPYSHKEGTQASWVVETREDAIRLYEEWLRAQPELMAAVKKELRGKTLSCWCSPLACHGDILLKIANEENNETT